MKSLISPFIKARLILTLWYSWMILLILIVFSVFIYTAQNRDFSRIVLQQQYGNNIPRGLTAYELREINAQVKELRNSFILNIAIIDSFILVLGAILSYVLAGKTLEPIQNNFEIQKEFTANASHELRTPLSAIQTTAEVALRSNKKTGEELRMVLSQIHDESLRMNKLIDELLTISRAESGMIKLSLEKLSLEKIAREAALEMTPLAEKKNQKLDITAEETFIRADRDRIKQLILILIDNAIKYTTPNGTIILAVKAKPKPQIKISDNGPGMSAFEKTKIFERFYRKDKARTGEGTGLGLSIAKWIADSHKAVIKVDSKMGNGSTFTVIFPQFTFPTATQPRLKTRIPKALLKSTAINKS